MECYQNVVNMKNVNKIDSSNQYHLKIGKLQVYEVIITIDSRCEKKNPKYYSNTANSRSSYHPRQLPTVSPTVFRYLPMFGTHTVQCIFDVYSFSVKIDTLVNNDIS